MAGAALLCGIHCLLTPILVVSLPFLALGAGMEWGAWAGTALLGMLVLTLGPEGGRIRHFALLGSGAGLWGTSLLGVLEPLPEWLTSSAGSVVVAGALLLSARRCEEGACVCSPEGPPPP